MQYAALCLAAIPSEQRPALTRFGHAWSSTELNTSHSTAGLEGGVMNQREGFEVKRIELSVPDYITLDLRM